MTHDDELRRIQDLAVKHAVEEMDAAAALGLDTKEGRGDRGWLTGMAGKSLSVAVKIEQFVALRAGRKMTAEDEEDEDTAKTRLVKEASAEVAEIMKRVRGVA
jgi:hypothetical protein